MNATETTTTTTATTATDGRRDPLAGVAETSREGCCADADLPCFDHFDHRCPEGHAWCSGGEFSEADRARCLTCAGIEFDS